jgi:hypothetical protein
MLSKSADPATKQITADAMVSMRAVLLQIRAQSYIHVLDSGFGHLFGRASGHRLSSG